MSLETLVAYKRTFAITSISMHKAPEVITINESVGKPKIIPLLGLAGYRLKLIFKLR